MNPEHRSGSNRGYEGVKDDAIQCVSFEVGEYTELLSLNDDLSDCYTGLHYMQVPSLVLS